MVELRPITEDNFSQVVHLSVGEAQKNFVASNVYSLAQAWLYENARPFAIYADGELVGFCMLDVNKRENLYGLWRFMIDEKHQQKGCGRAAMELIIEYLQVEGAREIRLSHEPSNRVASKLYSSLGFVPTGEVEDGEIVMKLSLELEQMA